MVMKYRLELPVLFTDQDSTRPEIRNCDLSYRFQSSTSSADDKIVKRLTFYFRTDEITVSFVEAAPSLAELNQMQVQPNEASLLAR